MRRIDALETSTVSQVSQVNQLYTPTCFNYGTLNHIVKECSLLMNPRGQTSHEVMGVCQHRNATNARNYQIRLPAVNSSYSKQEV